MALGPTCPNCAARVPFLRTQFNFGRTFACRRCDQALVVPRFQAFVIGMGLTLIFLFGRHDFPPEWGGGLGLLVLIVAVSLPVSWALTAVKRV
ncbi:hypothetical protein [Brevundimonas sp.]|uniref:hypothetical protein n=1 Tax=Brevundimonas sp. TaxID=1871086 RepID=UPI003565C920